MIIEIFYNETYSIYSPFDISLYIILYIIESGAMLQYKKRCT